MAAAHSGEQNLEANNPVALDTKLQNALHSLQQQDSVSTQASPQTVYIVTDMCYPTAADFDANRGTFNIDSVHSTKQSANARAKKIIFQSGRCKVDTDKIIEEVTEEKGLYTGIGIGGTADGQRGSCYARKCGVESKIVDEDSEDEVEEELNCNREERGRPRRAYLGDGDGDISMD
jgi:hypothetical protein